MRRWWERTREGEGWGGRLEPRFDGEDRRKKEKCDQRKAGCVKGNLPSNSNLIGVGRTDVIFYWSPSAQHQLVRTSLYAHASVNCTLQKRVVSALCPPFFEFKRIMWHLTAELHIKSRSEVIRSLIFTLPAAFMPLRKHFSGPELSLSRTLEVFIVWNWD